MHCTGLRYCGILPVEGKYGICTDIPGTGQRVWHVPSAPAVYGAAERAGGGCRD